MSFVKPVILKNGFTSTFWKLSFIGIDPLSNNVAVVINGYKDEQAFLDGSDAAVSKSIEFKVDEIPDLQQFVDEIESRSAQILE